MKDAKKDESRPEKAQNEEESMARKKRWTWIELLRSVVRRPDSEHERKYLKGGIRRDEIDLAAEYTQTLQNQTTELNCAGAMMCQFSFLISERGQIFHERLWTLQPLPH